MPLVVMLTSLAGPSLTGPDIDIVAGDLADCKPSTAIHLVAVGYARELCLKGSDDKRPLKWLDNPATHPTATGEPITPAKPTEPPSTTNQQPPSKKTRPRKPNRQSKDNTDANKRTQSPEA